MLVRVTLEDAVLLRQLEIRTYQETFGPSISQPDLDDYYERVLSLEQIKKDLENPESETYFFQEEGQNIGFLKFNWGQAQSEKTGLDHAFEIHRIYLLKPYQGKGYGKILFDFALSEARARAFDWAWLGVWEENFKAQDFYFSYGFEKFSQHEYITGDTVDTDWLLRLSLKDKE